MHDLEQVWGKKDSCTHQNWSKKTTKLFLILYVAERASLKKLILLKKITGTEDGLRIV